MNHWKYVLLEIYKSNKMLNGFRIKMVDSVDYPFNVESSLIALRGNPVF